MKHTHFRSDVKVVGLKWVFAWNKSRTIREDAAQERHGENEMQKGVRMPKQQQRKGRNGKREKKAAAAAKYVCVVVSLSAVYVRVWALMRAKSVPSLSFSVNCPLCVRVWCVRLFSLLFFFCSTLPSPRGHQRDVRYYNFLRSYCFLSTSLSLCISFFF